MPRHALYRFGGLCYFMYTQGYLDQVSLIFSLIWSWLICRFMSISDMCMSKSNSFLHDVLVESWLILMSWFHLLIYLLESWLILIACCHPWISISPLLISNSSWSCFLWCIMSSLIDWEDIFFVGWSWSFSVSFDLSRLSSLIDWVDIIFPFNMLCA